MADVVKTQAELLAEMQAALNTGDFRAVSKISSEIAKAVAGQEKSEKDAKLAAVADLTLEVKGKFDKLANTLRDSKKLDACDGIWYYWDFGEAVASCRLLKSQPKAKGTGGGGGKKFNVSTNELLEKHGAEVMNAETGQTYQQAYEASTEGNSRYNIRTRLLKIAGIS